MFWERRAYLDFAAGTTANPSSPHAEGRRAKRVLEDARAAIARLVEVQADDVIFTSGATESNALAILGSVRSRQKAVGSYEKIHVLYLPSAHASIVENVKLLDAEGVHTEPLPVKEYRVDTEALAKMLRPHTALISMDAVCGETGVVWNTREVAELLRKHSEGKPTRVLLHVDASQAPMTEKITRAHFGADLLSFDAAKVGGARGIGALIAHRTIPLVPLYAGGGQERGLRSGSEAPELAARFAAALRAAALGRDAFRTSAKCKRDHLIKTITSSIQSVYLQEGRVQAPHILNLSLPGRDTDYLLALLDEAGFAVSSRSACETDSEDGSRAVFVLTGDKNRARATLRISWGPQTCPSAFRRFARTLAEQVFFIDSAG